MRLAACVAVHFGHLHVHEYGVVALAPHHVHGFPTIVGHFHADTLCRQEAHGHFLIDDVVLGQQQPCAMEPDRRRGLPGHHGARCPRFAGRLFEYLHQGVEEYRLLDGLGQETRRFRSLHPAPARARGRRR